MSVEKYSNEWYMWRELFKWRDKWTNPKNEEEIVQATNEAINLGEKYKGLGTDIIIVLLKYMKGKKYES